jgi:pimeloyl-ACP methyl ester carboxylesterase
MARPSRSLRRAGLVGLVASLSAATAASAALGASAAPAPAPPARPAAAPAAASSGTSGTASATAVAVARAAAALPAAYTRQVIRWEPCFDRNDPPEGLPASALRLQCGAFRAPRDWATPTTASSVVVAVSRYPSTKRPAKGATFTNPGGPGVPGWTLPLSFLLAGRTGLLATQDVYGLDPRGVGYSTNTTCGNPKLTSYDPRDRSGANLGRILDQARALAARCDAKGGRVIDSVGTASTVRDMDLLRQLVKVKKINYVGYSAGSWLGAQYATTFPSRTGRFVLDSNLEFTTSWKVASAWQPRGFERRFRADFAGWAAQHDDRYGLGGDAAAVRATYEAVRAAVAKQPLAVAGGRIDGPVLDGLIADGLYSKYDFPALAARLADVRSSAGLDQAPAAGVAAARARSRLAADEDVRRAVGGAVELPGADGRPRRELAGAAGVAPFAADAETAAFLATLCNDTPWPATRAQLVADSAAQGKRYPLLGWDRLNQPCATWKRPKGLGLRSVTGKGLPRILMVQSENDPATPIEGAKRANAKLAGSRMLVVRKEGDHALYASGNSCVDRAVERFLTTGVLPAAGATCTGTAMPVPEEAQRSAPLLLEVGAPGDPLARAATIDRSLRRPAAAAPALR